MRVMSSIAKKEIYELVDALPDDELPAARRYLEFLRTHGSDPYIHLDETDPFDELSDDERERLHAALEESRAQHQQGLGIPAEEVMRRLRSR